MGKSNRDLKALLSVDEVRQFFDYDGVNLVWKQYPGHIQTHGRMKGKVAGRVNNYGYRVVKVKEVQHGVHRLIWLWVYGVWPKAQIDHINMDKLDNRIENLREANHQQQGWNTNKHPSNKTGFKGVKFDARYNKFIATISVNWKRIHLGSFDTVKEAAEAYAAGAKKYHGEFARPS